MPHWQDVENQLGQAGQQFTQAGQNVINQAIDQPTAMKLMALKQASQNQMMPPPMPPGAGAGSAVSSVPLSFDAFAAQQAKLNQPPVQPEQHDFSGYQDYAPPRPFAKLQQKMQQGHPINKQDIRETLHGAQEVTPELEAKLFPKQDQEQEDGQSVQTAGN